MLANGLGSPGLQYCESTTKSAFVKTRLHIESRDRLPFCLRSDIVTVGSRVVTVLSGVPVNTECDGE